MTQQPAPRVFISYSHDTVEHQERVLGLADRLRAGGIDAEVDQYNAAPPEGWPLWCERQIAAADIVLMVCTETYHRRVSGDEERGKGLGVVCEARIIRQLLYDAGGASDKFVPVLFSDASPEHIPMPIRGGTRYVVDTEDGYEDLYRRLTGQPHLLRPALGAIRPLPARRRLWSEAQAEAATAPAPSFAARSSEGRGTVTAGVDRRVHIRENMIGGIVTDDHNVTEVHRKVTLPSVDRIDIRSELAALNEQLAGLNTGDRTKIANALAEAADEAAKPQPDKNEIGGALERALGYAGKVTDFGDKAGKIAAHVQNAVDWLGDDWHKLLSLVGNRDRGTVNLRPDGGRNLKIGIIVGLLFVLPIVLFQELRVIRQNPDWAIDTIMPYLAGVVQNPTRAKPFVFIAVDEESYRTWQEPWFTPRDKIAQIIETIADEHNPPLAIVVDIDLSRASDEAFLSEYENPDSIGRVGSPSRGATGVRSQNEGVACDSLTNGNDKKLCQAIIDAAAKQIPVVLARDFNVGFRDPHSVGPLRPRGSFLDPILGTAQRSSSSAIGATAPPWVSTRSPLVFWGSPLFNRDGDLTIRRWRLWERACLNDVIAAVPSVQLLVAALVQPVRVEDAIGGLEQSLRLSKQAPCSEEPDLITPQLQLDHLRVDLADKEFGQRIVFALGTHAVSPMVPLASSAEGGSRKTREEKVRLLEVISANRLTNTSFDPALFRDRIVVIGASYQESGDIHATPAGPMDGALMIINSIHTLLDYGQLRPPPWPIRILLNGIVVAVIAILFHIFNASLAGSISIAMLFVVFFVVNAITLPYSMLVDVSLAGALFTFYKWFGSGFFNDGSFAVFRKGWDKNLPGRKPWRWRIKKNNLAWKALPAKRYHPSKQRDIIHPNETMGREHGTAGRTAD